MKIKCNDIIIRNSIFAYIAGATCLLLLVPLIAMQFSNEVCWDRTDFIVMGLLIFGTFTMFVLTARKVSRNYWPHIGVILAGVFFYLWAELAVGIFTNWGS